MFKNIGTLLKGLALFLFILGIGFSFIYGIKTIQTVIVAELKYPVPIIAVIQ